MFTELAELVTFPLSQGSSTQYDNRFYYFPVFIPRRYKDVFEFQVFSTSMFNPWCKFVNAIYV